MFKKIILAVILVLFCTISNAEADVNPVLGNAIVKVFSGGAGGSGTLVYADEEKGYVVTCKHVVGNNRTAKAVFINGYESSGPVLGRGQYYDTAIFRIKPPIPCIYIPISKTWPENGEEVDIFGYGGQYNQNIKTIKIMGWSSKVRSYKPFRAGSDYGHRIQLDPLAMSGDSGGPVLHDDLLVGIVEGGMLQSSRGPAIDSHGPYSRPILNLLEQIDPVLFDANNCPGGICYPPRRPIIVGPRGRRQPFQPQPIPNPPTTSPPSTSPPLPDNPQPPDDPPQVTVPPVPCPNTEDVEKNKEAIKALQDKIDQLTEKIDNLPDPTEAIKELKISIESQIEQVTTLINNNTTTINNTNNDKQIEQLKKSIDEKIKKLTTIVNNNTTTINNIANSTDCDDKIDDLKDDLESKISNLTQLIQSNAEAIGQLANNIPSEEDLTNAIKNDPELIEMLKGEDGVAPTAQEILEAIKNDPEAIALLKGDGATAEEIVEAIKNDPEAIALLKGQKGDKGDPGDPAQPPDVDDSISHMVLIADSNGEYWPRLSQQYETAKAYYSHIKFLEPPTDKNIGPIPLLVLYKDGKPIQKHVGLRAVADALSAIIRGEFDQYFL